MKFCEYDHNGIDSRTQSVPNFRSRSRCMYLLKWLSFFKTVKLRKNDYRTGCKFGTINSLFRGYESVSGLNCYKHLFYIILFFIVMLSVALLTVTLVGVALLSVTMLGVAFFIVMLSAALLSVTLLSLALVSVTLLKVVVTNFFSKNVVVNIGYFYTVVTL
jgi:hypothetical protein